jgi:hypothetical protein
MPDRISELLQEYDDLVSTIAGANHRLYQTSLAQWFSLIDATSDFARVVSGLEALSDFDAWYEDLQRRQKSAGADLHLPNDQNAALGIQIALFRRMARGEINAAIFAHEFISPGERNLNTNVGQLSQQLFIPTARSLRRQLERAEAPGLSLDLSPLFVPASDRTVTLDHNAAEYAQAVRSLEKVEDAIQQANDYDDPKDKEQRIAELSAGKRLLQATRARADVLIALLYRGLLYLAKKFADVAIGVAATAALALLGRLTGLW